LQELFAEDRRWHLNNEIIPVLKEEVLEYLKPHSESIILDGTFGGGGHSRAILEKLGSKGRLVGVDRDQSNVIYAQKLQAEFSNFQFVKSRFSNLEYISEVSGTKKFDGMLLDIGVSSFQLDIPERGFSFRYLKEKLDMRMDQSDNLTAADILNSYSKEELEEIFQIYGEERLASEIAKEIVQFRKIHIIKLVENLVTLIEKVYNKHRIKQKIHPATRVFQALRIEVNQELRELQDFLNGFLSYLNRGGRLLIITFHSLEDRIVKNKFKELAGKCVCGKPVMECTCPREKKAKIIKPFPVFPKFQEKKRNRRSRSAKLRILEKI
jgi:16S rRNA (cytosine1402-N4)-methyltransferase